MTSVFTWLGPAITIVMFLGAASVYLLGSKDKATIQQLKENNASLDEAVTILERKTTRLEAEVLALRNANEVLAKTVTSADQIAALSAQLSEHHKEAMAAWSRIEKLTRTATQDTP